MTPEFGAATPAREDRHARLRRLRRDQQVRPQGRGRRAARRAQAVPAQPASAWTTTPEDMPVYGTIASQFNDDGVTALYQALLPKLAEHGLQVATGGCRRVATRQSTATNVIVPPARTRYLAEIAETVRAYHARSGDAEPHRARGAAAAGGDAMLEQALLHGRVTTSRRSGDTEIDQGVAATNQAPASAGMTRTQACVRGRPLSRCSPTARPRSTRPARSSWRSGRRCSGPTPATNTS